MNILVLSWRDPKHPLAGGAEQVMHEHMKAWTEAGHKVTLFSSKMPLLGSLDKIDGIAIVRKGYQYWGVQFAAFFYYLKNRKNFDLVVDQFHGIPFFTPLYVKARKIAVIQEIAGKVWFLNPLPFPLNYLIGLIGYIGEPFLFLFYKKISFMTGSASTKDGLIKLGLPPKNIYIIPHGIIVKKIKGKIKKEKIPTVIFLGIHSKDKGIEDAIKSFGILNDKNFMFWTVGKFETKEYEVYINSLIKKQNLKNKIKLWGFVSQDKKFELLSRAHILINPSVHEGWGLVNIEANAVGTPVVAYQSSGLVDSVKDGFSGKLVTINSPISLAREINNLIDDPKGFKHLSKSAIEWSEKFTWQISKKLSLDLINKILK